MTPLAFVVLTETNNRFTSGQKIKLVIAACLWNNPQVCRQRIGIFLSLPVMLKVLIASSLPAPSRSVYWTSLATFWIAKLSEG